MPILQIATSHQPIKQNQQISDVILTLTWTFFTRNGVACNLYIIHHVASLIFWHLHYLRSWCYHLAASKLFITAHVLSKFKTNRLEGLISSLYYACFIHLHTKHQMLALKHIHSFIKHTNNVFLKEKCTHMMSHSSYIKKHTTLDHPSEAAMVPSLYQCIVSGLASVANHEIWRIKVTP